MTRPLSETAFGGDSPYGLSLSRSVEHPTPAHCPRSGMERPSWLWYGHCCVLDKRLRRDYGIGCEDYHRLLERQDGRCALCGLRPRKWRLVVHHSHSDGAVIAALHFTCNRLIDPMLWLLPRLVQLMYDPPGRELGLMVPPAKMRRLEAKYQAKLAKARQGGN